MGQYYYVPDPGEQRAMYTTPVLDRMAQFRQNQAQQTIGQSPISSPAQPTQPPQSASSGIIWVSSKQEADSYPVTYGNAVALWDSNAPEDRPVIYLRQADSTGKPTTKVYDLVERTDYRPAPTVQQIDMGNIVTWDKLDEYLAEKLKRPSKAQKAKEDIDG